MRIGVACASRRGLLCLRRIADRQPSAELDVFSFREEAHEPLFREAIREETEARGGTFREARQLGRKDLASYWADTPPDLLLVVGWRYMIPRRVYERPGMGTFVLHDSPLPNYRGFSPTVWAIVNGESSTGATLFRIAEDVDSGPIVDRAEVPIGPDDPVGVVMERVTVAYGELIDRNLDALLAGTATETAQDESLATYTCKRLPEDGAIDWSRPTRRIHDLVRALSNPYPGAFTTLDGERVTIWSARLPDPDPTYVGSVPGRVAEVRPDGAVLVLTGDGSLLVERAQRGGEDARNASEVLTRLSMTLGT